MMAEKRYDISDMAMTVDERHQWASQSVNVNLATGNSKCQTDPFQPLNAVPKSNSGPKKDN